MSLEDDARKLFKSLVNNIRKLPKFPTSSFCDRLHNKARYNSNVELLRKYIEKGADYPPDGNEEDWNNQFIDQLNAGYYLKLLANFGFADGILNVDHSKDKQGYKARLDAKNLNVRYLEVISIVLGYCLGEWINTALEKAGARTLKDIRDLQIKDYLYDFMKDDSFINSQIRQDEVNKDHRFSIYMLFIADYLIYQPGAWPGYSEDETARPSYQILQTWSEKIWEQHIGDDEKLMDDHVTFCGQLSTITFVPANQWGIIQPAPAFTVLKDFYRMSTRMARMKGTPLSLTYADAVSKSVDRLQAAEEVINEWKTYCEDVASNFKVRYFSTWASAVDSSFSQNDWSSVDEWAGRCYTDDMNYTTRRDLKIWTSPPYSQQRPGSYFLSGTQVVIGHESTRTIEGIKEGEKVLATVGPPQFAVLAKRDPVFIKTRLVGFNSQKPFSTISQVFMTTTGLRAIDPRAAQALNPFQQIGRLAVGHCLYRLNGNSYELVEITSIELSPQTDETLHRVALEGDVQSLHANGYLVACDDPLNSAKRTARLLQQLPKDQRLLYLVNQRQILPLLQKYSLQTIEDSLDREIRDLEHAPWRFCRNAASLRLRPSGGVPLDLLERRFRLTAYHEEKLPSGYILPDLNIVDGSVIADGQVVLRTVMDARARTFRWTRELPQQGVFEHACMRVYPHGKAGSGVVYLTADADPDDIGAKPTTLSFRALAISPSKIATPKTTSNDGSFEVADTLSLTIDKTVWPPDTNWNTVKDPTSGGTIELGTYTSPGGYSVPTARIPSLDDIQTKINQAKGRNLEPLYRCVSTRSEAGNPIFTVEINRAAWLPFLADGGTSGSNFGLKFQSKLGVDAQLPCLFEELRIEQDLFWPEDSKAVLFEYNAKMRGMKGNRHFVSVESALTQVEYFNALRAKVSRAFAGQSPFAPSDSGVSNRSPAGCTNYLAAYQGNSVSDLIDFHLYDDQAAHDASQRIIQKMMFYHMDQDARANFTNSSKPTDLPSSLADNLKPELKTFLKTKYAPAYLCQSFEATHKYRAMFTDKERKKLWYWWHGNGEKCLARTKEYKELTNLTGVQGVKNLYGYFINSYLSDNPKSWAQSMLKVLQDPQVLDYVLTTPIQDTRNVVNQQSTIMHALAPDDNNAEDFFEKIVTYSMQRGLENPTISENQAEARQWLEDSLLTLTEKVIAGDSSIATSVRRDLLEDVNTYESDNGLDQSLSAAERARNIVAKQSAVLDEASKWVTSEGKNLDSAWSGASLYQWIGEAWDNISEKYESSKVLKGLFTTSFAAYKLFRVSYSLVGLIGNWDDMSNANRATTILEMMVTVIEGIEVAFDAWSIWKGNQGMGVLDHLGTLEMDQGIYRILNERGRNLASMADQVNPDGFHTTVAERVGGDGIATGSKLKDEWNTPIDEIADDLSPGGKKAASEFRIKGNVIKILSTVLALAVAIAITFDLIHNWDNLSLVDKILGVLAVVVEFLTVALEVVSLGVDIGLWALSATLSAALPVIGTVLAVIGVVLMLLGLLFGLFGNDAPKDPVQAYIEDTGRSLIAGFGDAPDTQLTYSVSPLSATAGSVTSFTIEGANNSSSDITLSGITISLLSGDSDSCLFSDKEDKIVLVDDNDPDKTKPRHVFVTPSSNVGGSLPFRSRLEADTRTYYQYDLQVGGPKKEREGMLQALVLKPAERFKAVWTSTVRSGQTSRVDVVERVKSDMFHAQLSITRG